MDTVVVTGAGEGLGRAVASAFADPGTVVVVGVRDLDAGEALADALDTETLVVRADPRDEFDVERLMEQASRAADESGIDVVAPCAQVYHGPVGETPLDAASYSAFDDTIRTNSRGVFAAVTESLPHLTGDARILVPTGAVARGSAPGYGVFAVAAAATEAVVRGFSEDREDLPIVALEVGPAAGSGSLDDDTAGEFFTWAAALDLDAFDGWRLTVDDWESAIQ